MEKKKEETVNLLIRNLPKPREEIVKTTLSNMAKMVNEEWIIEPAPVSIENMIKLLAVLEIGQKQVKAELNKLRVIGFSIDTQKVKNILKLRDEHLFNAISKMQKNIDAVYNTVMKLKPKEIPTKPKKKPKKKVEKITSKTIESYGVKGKVITKILLILANNPDKEFTTSGLSKRIYGKITRSKTKNIARIIKPHEKFIDTKRRGSFNYYMWNPKAVRVM